MQKVKEFLLLFGKTIISFGTIEISIYIVSILSGKFLSVINDAWGSEGLLSFVFSLAVSVLVTYYIFSKWFHSLLVWFAYILAVLFFMLQFLIVR